VLPSFELDAGVVALVKLSYLLGVQRNSAAALALLTRTAARADACAHMPTFYEIERVL
jgi:hypothetical protein